MWPVRDVRKVPSLDAALGDGLVAARSRPPKQPAKAGENPARQPETADLRWPAEKNGRHERLAFMTPEQALRQSLNRELSMRQRVFCGLVSFLTALIYVNVVWFVFKYGLLLHLKFDQALEYDRPIITLQLLDICYYLTLFPFGYVPYLNQFAVLLNMLFWSILSGVIYASFTRRKAIAYKK